MILNYLSVRNLISRNHDLIENAQTKPSSQIQFPFVALTSNMKEKKAHLAWNENKSEVVFKFNKNYDILGDIDMICKMKMYTQLGGEHIDECIPTNL